MEDLWSLPSAYGVYQALGRQEELQNYCSHTDSVYYNWLYFVHCLNERKIYQVTLTCWIFFSTLCMFMQCINRFGWGWPFMHSLWFGINVHKNIDAYLSEFWKAPTTGIWNGKKIRMSLAHVTYRDGEARVSQIIDATNLSHIILCPIIVKHTENTVQWNFS